MTRGPKPKPTALKKAAGNPGKRPLNPAEARPDPSRPNAPRWLGQAAKREWKRVASRLHQAGLLTYIDRSLLAAYCQAYGRWVEAELQLKTQPLVVISDKGNLYQNPWVGVARAAMTDMIKIAAEFGMSPSARSRIRVAPQAEQLSLADILFGADG